MFHLFCSFDSYCKTIIDGSNNHVRLVQVHFEMFAVGLRKEKYFAYPLSPFMKINIFLKMRVKAIKLKEIIWKNCLIIMVSLFHHCILHFSFFVLPLEGQNVATKSVLWMLDFEFVCLGLLWFSVKGRITPVC